MARPRFNYHKPKKRGMAALTIRERQTLSATCEYGLTNVQTARVFGVSHQTVKCRLMRIKEKVGGRNIAQICYEYRGWRERKAAK